MSDSESTANSSASPTPLGRNERRVLGVLVEKAKTTPDNYPMSLAAIVAGCNQKSNRSPVMQMDDDDVQMALDKLRAMGATMEIQGSSRVSKFRHLAYEFLGVDGAGSAVMTELMLRGPQTLGELRTRASRMNDFPDLDSVAACVAVLQTKKLVQAMTPPGRGQTFAHALYPPDEQRYLAAKVEKFQTDPMDEVEEAVVATKSPAHDSRLAAVEERLEELRLRLEELESRLPS